MAGDVGEFVLVAHGVIEQLDAAALGERVQNVGRGNAVEIGATACAARSDVRITDSSVA